MTAPTTSVFPSHVIQVIRTEGTVGAGTAGNPYRRRTEYHLLDGTLIGWSEPGAEDESFWNKERTDWIMADASQASP